MTQTRTTILVVEDDDDIARTFTDILQEEHYAVRCASDGQQAYDILMTEHIDLVVLDLMMPNVNGWALLQRMAEQQSHPWPPVIVTSAAMELNQKTAGLHIAGVLAKPFRLEHVCKLIKRHLVSHKESVHET